jgi:hypothetical protein
MKVVMLGLVCFMLSTGISFAEGVSDTYSKDRDTHTQSGYKSSPRLDYHSSKPVKQEKGYGSKPSGATPGIGGFANPNSSKDSTGNTGNDRRNF